MQRIGWLDSSRGLAILMLILIHYVGALESRGIISEDIMLCIKAVLRVATPFFILIFGFTFFTLFSRKVTTLADVYSLYKKLSVKLVYLFLAREFIVLFSALRFDYSSDYLFSVLLYMETSDMGEILTFYMIALLVSPIALYVVKPMRPLWVLCLAVVVYIFGYSIGSNFESSRDDILFRLFFYNVYPFFPFYGLVLLGFFFSKIYSIVSDDRNRLLFFLSVSFLSILCSFAILNQYPGDVLRVLADAGLKSPPSVSYMLLYIGVTLLIVLLNASLIKREVMPNVVGKVLDTIGRNSLLAYTLHYTLFLPSFILHFVFDSVGKLIEVAAFILMILFLYSILVLAERSSAKSRTDAGCGNS